MHAPWRWLAPCGTFQRPALIVAVTPPESSAQLASTPPVGLIRSRLGHHLQIIDSKHLKVTIPNEDRTAPSMSTSAIATAPPSHVCTLNCIHCISRHSRDRPATLSDDAWDRLETALTTGRLVHLRTDYSGDLLFAARRHAAGCGASRSSA